MLESSCIEKIELNREKSRKEKLAQELEIHGQMDFKGIVKLHETFEDSTKVYVVMELCENKSLSDLVRRRGRLTELEMRCYVAQIVEIMHFFEDRRIWKFKLGDFGLATIVKDGERRRSLCGTPNYIAPEMLNPTIGHSFETDVWALGVILYTCIFGRPPFESKSLEQTYQKIKRVDYKFPQHIDASESCKDLIKKCLEKNFDNRIKLEDIMLHEFFDQSYPELMPLSSLNCPPSLSYIKSFLIDKNNPFKCTYQSIDEVSTNYLAKCISNTRKAEKIDLSLIERNMESSCEKVKYINTENDFTKEL